MAPLIRVLGEEEEIAITFEMVAAYHGQAALAMLAIVFQGLGGALARLSPEAPLPRKDIGVVSGHPGPGVRDAFEFVTRAVTRQAYTIDRSLPLARWNPHADMAYAFTITARDRTVTAALRADVLPPRFFALLPGPRSAEDDAEFSALKRAIAATVLRQSSDRLFDWS